MSIYREDFKIRGNDTGPNLKVTLAAVAGFLQEAAWMHSMELQVSIYDLLRKGFTWVLTRLSIRLKVLPGHNENLSVVTWPSGYEKQNIFRDYLLKDNSGNDIGMAKSVWVILDLKSRQPIPAPPFITAIPLQSPLPNLPFNNERIEIAPNYSHSRNFTANWHDIDINHHVNHISFIKWAIESAPFEVLKSKQATAIDIVFRAESTFNDEIKACSEVMDGTSGMILHKLIRIDDQKELILAKSHWR